MGTRRRCAPPALGLALALLLLLLPALRPPGIGAAPLQGPALSHFPCKSFSNYEESQKCCRRRPSGYEQKMQCPTDLRCDCVKLPCESGQYLNLVVLRCESCVTCRAEHHLVEKAPCTTNSNRVCECQPGWYCQTPVENTCYRCTPHHTCKPGFRVKVAGTPFHDTVCEKCPPGTFSDADSSAQRCKHHTEYARLNKVTTSPGVSLHDKRFPDQPTEQVVPMAPVATTGLPPGTYPAPSLSTTTRGPMAPFNTSHLGVTTLEKRSRRDGNGLALVGAVFLSVLVLFAGLVILWRKRACDKWIVPHKAKTVSNQAKICAKKIEALAYAENSPTEGEPLTETSDDGSPSELESVHSPEPDGAELVQVGTALPLEPPPRGHANNHIEKVYIMRAETVIVGSVSEVPSGKTCPMRDEEGSATTEQGVMETELAMRYPEQETEYCPGSDFTTPVEEEWEFHHSGEKTLAI